MRLRQFTDPWQDDGVHEADTDACNDSRADEHACVCAARHQGGAKDAKRRSNENAAFAAYLVANPSCSRSDVLVHTATTCLVGHVSLSLSLLRVYRTTYEASPHPPKIISCGKPALFSRVGYHTVVADICHLDEAWRGANCSEDTLIIAF